MRFDGHTHFVTVGRRSASRAARCRPAASSGSRPCRRSCSTHWPVAERVERRRAARPSATGAATAPIEHEGVRYGQKAHSLRAADRPAAADRRRVRAGARRSTPSEVADLAALAANGWPLLDPARGRRDARRVPRLRAGLDGRVRDRQGAATSLPLRLVQRSQRLLPRLRPAGPCAGHGIRRRPAGRRGPARLFDDREDAAAASEAILRRPEVHARAAREIAEEVLDSDRVLGLLLEELGASG